MGVLSDREIRARVWNGDLVINPFSEGEPRPNTISYGLSSYGYDVRVGYKFKVFSNLHGSVVDPKNFDPLCFIDIDLSADKRHNPVVLPGQVGYVCTNCGMHLGKMVQLHDNECRHAKPNHIQIPPNSFALAESVEYFQIPRDVIGLVVDKSTYRRCGIVMGATILEPCWTGTITLEITNATPLPARIYANEGIAQVLFLRGDGVCMVSYADRKGKYDNQRGVTLPKVTS